MSRAPRRPDTKAPRLSSGRTLRPVPHLEIEDDGVYTDMEVSHGRLANRVARNVRFERVHLHETDLSHSRLEGLVLADVRLDGCDLANGAWRGASIDRVELIGCRLTGLDLAEASLRNLVARQCGGPLVSFRFAEVKSSRFEDWSGCSIRRRAARGPICQIESPKGRSREGDPSPSGECWAFSARAR